MENNNFQNEPIINLRDDVEQPKDEEILNKMTDAEKRQKQIKKEWSEEERDDKIDETNGKETVEEENKEKEKEIVKEVIDYFKNDLAINKKELQNIKGFSSLSEGQQLLVLENIKQVSIGRVSREAIAEQKKEQKGFVSKKGKFWQIKNDWTDTKEHLKVFSQNIWINGFKNFAGKKVAELEKLKFEEMEKGGMKAYGAIAKQLVGGMIDKETGKTKKNIPEVEKIGKKSGGYELEIKYLAVSDDMDAKQKKIAEKFNQSASEFSKIPDQWMDKTAKALEKKKYNNARKKYEKARSKVMKTESERFGGKNASLEMNEIDYKLRMNQFLNSNPDVEEQIQSIKNKTAWKRAMENMFRERAFQMSAGFITKTATIALGGAAGLSVAIAAPAAVLGLGAHRAVKKGKKNLDEGYELTRRTTKERSEQEGEKEADFLKQYSEIKQKIKELEKRGELNKKESKEIKKYKNELKILDKQEAQKLLSKKDFVDAEYLSDSFEALTDELRRENLVVDTRKDNRRDEMIKSLIFNIKETQEKINDKTINFGGEDEFLPNYYKLIEKLSEAEGLVNTHKIFKNLDVENITKKDLEGTDGKSGIKELVYNIQNKKISKSKIKHLLGKAGIGIASSAAFFYAGSHIRDCVGGYIPDSAKKFAKDTYDNIRRDLVKLNLNSDITDLEQIDKDVMETLKNLSEEDREYIAKHGLSEYAQRQFNENSALDTNNGDVAEKIESTETDDVKDNPAVKEPEPAKEAPAQEPAKGAPKEVIEELKETVGRQETIKDIAAKVAEQEAAMAEHGLKKDFTLKLGENGTPARLERTMYMIAMDAMDDEEMYTEIKGGVKLFDEEPAARSLNVAANLSKMAQGELNNIRGVEITDEMRNSFIFNKETGELEIKDYAEFNELVKNLHEHAEKLWGDEILQKEAVGYLDRIDKGAWQDIIEANGLEENVKGHDDLDVKIKNFKNDSEMVQKAEKVIRAREAKILADLKAVDKDVPELSKNQESIKTVDNGKGTEKIIESFAKERMNGKITEIYRHWGGGNQIEEWNIMRNKNAQDVLDGKFGEHIGNQFDWAESNNREQLQDYLKEAESAIGKPGVDEIVENYVLRFETGVLEKYSEVDATEHTKFLKEHENLRVEYIKNIYKQMPESIRDNGEQALNYLKISTG
ncbi:MAG: hypothetical protein U9M94_01110, partial [Patescibacteria group bacterium]|nr:hypothetical protein [Patescibacteria group bacterium]